MPSTKRRATAKLERFRGRHHKLDHVIRMVTHYGNVNGAAQAGAVTFFGFLSFFPIMALAFFAVGLLAQVYPDLKADIRIAIESFLPGVVGNGKDEIPLSTFESYGSAVGALGVLGLLYSGLGWLSGMRDALETMFQMPEKEQPNFFVGKIRDFGSLLLIGLTLIASVALSGLVAGFSESVLGWFGVDPRATVPTALLWLASHSVAIVVSTVLLLTLFTLLAKPDVPRRSLVDGALLGAIGFEVLKALAYFLIAQTKGQPAFQTFGVALILLVWINYFSRLVMYAASYAYTSPAAVRLREQTAVDADVAAAQEDAAPVERALVAAPDPEHDTERVSAPPPELGPASEREPVPGPVPERGTAPPRAPGVNFATSPRPGSAPAPGAAGRHSAAVTRDQRRTAVTAGALVAATGAAALLARRRARMNR